MTDPSHVAELLLGIGHGAFERRTLSDSLQGDAFAVALGDVNNDGLLDVFVQIGQNQECWTNDELIGWWSACPGSKLLINQARLHLQPPMSRTDGAAAQPVAGPRASQGNAVFAPTPQEFGKDVDNMYLEVERRLRT